MAVKIAFNLDTQTENRVQITIRSPYADLGRTRDNISDRLDETAQSPKALMPVRDADTGNYVFVNTMKLSDIRVFEVEKE